MTEIEGTEGTAPEATLPSPPTETAAQPDGSDPTAELPVADAGVTLSSPQTERAMLQGHIREAMAQTAETSTDDEGEDADVDPEPDVLDELDGDDDPQVQPQLLDLAEFGNDVVNIKADGQQTTVSLSDLVTLAQKGANYERKSTELGTLRAQLEKDAELGEAIRNDPDRFVKLRLEQLGLPYPSATQSAPDADDYYDEPVYGEAPQNQVDPMVAELKQRLAALEPEINEIRQRRRANEAETFLANAFDRIESQHGEFDRVGVRELMIQKSISDPDVAHAAFLFGQGQRSAAPPVVEQEVRRRARNASRPHRVGAKVPDRGPSKPPGDLDRLDAIKVAMDTLKV